MRDTTYPTSTDVSTESTLPTITQPLANVTLLLQSVMESIGWHDMRHSVQEAETKEQLQLQKLNVAFTHYQATHNETNRERLLQALKDVVVAAEAEQAYAVKQQRHYQQQAEKEAAQRKEAQKSSYSTQWREWALAGAKHFFGATAEQQAEKYAAIVKSRQTLVSQLTQCIEEVEELDRDVFVPDELVSVKDSSITETHAPIVFQLADLNGQNGFKMDGEKANDRSGFSVSGVGDINKDGRLDIIIGASYASSDSQSHVGCSYIVFGGAGQIDGGLLSLASLNGSNGFKIYGENFAGSGVGGSSGYSVGEAEDVNADGTVDIVIGAPVAPGQTSQISTGRSYVVFGGLNVGNSGTLDLALLNGVNGFKIYGEEGGQYQFGYSVSGLGDVNGDTFDDLLVSAPGVSRAYVVFGTPGLGSEGTLNVSQLDGSNGFKLVGGFSYDAGYSVSGVEDINSDGYNDLLVGAWGYGTPFQIWGYVIFGGMGVGSNGSVMLADLNGVNGGFQIIGEPSSSSSGIAVSGAGDVNGDGHPDFLIGDFAATFGGSSDIGRSYVIFGGVGVGTEGTLNLVALNGTDGFKISAETDITGYSVSGAGDINRDGYSDLLVGSYGLKVYLIYGGIGLGSGGLFNLNDLNGTNGLQLSGETTSPMVVSDISDFNGDGVDDFLIGSYASNSYAGRSYVVFGEVPPQIQTNTLTLLRGETVFLNSIFLSATSVTYSSGSLVFIPTEISHGYFEDVSQSGTLIANFTQQQVTVGNISFVHDGTDQAPTYSVIVRSMGIGVTGPVPAAIYFSLVPPSSSSSSSPSSSLSSTVNSSASVSDISSSSSGSSSSISGVSSGSGSVSVTSSSSEVSSESRGFSSSSSDVSSVSSVSSSVSVPSSSSSSSSVPGSPSSSGASSDTVPVTSSSSDATSLLSSLSSVDSSSPSSAPVSSSLKSASSTSSEVSSGIVPVLSSSSSSSGSSGLSSVPSSSSSSTGVASSGSDSDNLGEGIGIGVAIGLSSGAILFCCVKYLPKKCKKADKQEARGTLQSEQEDAKKAISLDPIRSEDYSEFFPQPVQEEKKEAQEEAKDIPAEPLEEGVAVDKTPIIDGDDALKENLDEAIRLYQFEAGAEKLRKALSQHVHLKHLDFSNKGITSKSALLEAKNFPVFPALTHLNLSNNSLGDERKGGKGVKNLCELLLQTDPARFPSLVRLDLSHNAIRNKGFSSIITLMEKTLEKGSSVLPKLEFVVLRDNLIGSKNLLESFSSQCDLYQRKIIVYLSGNLLSRVSESLFGKDEEEISISSSQLEKKEVPLTAPTHCTESFFRSSPISVKSLIEVKEQITPLKWLVAIGKTEEGFFGHALIYLEGMNDTGQRFIQRYDIRPDKIFSAIVHIERFLSYEKLKRNVYTSNDSVNFNWIRPIDHVAGKKLRTLVNKAKENQEKIVFITTGGSENIKAVNCMQWCDDLLKQAGILGIEEPRRRFPPKRDFPKEKLSSQRRK